MSLISSDFKVAWSLINQLERVSKLKTLASEVEPKVKEQLRIEALMKPSVKAKAQLNAKRKRKKPKITRAPAKRCITYKEEEIARELAEKIKQKAS